jgi:hypothetical protein
MIKTTTIAVLLFLFIQFTKAQTPYIVDNCFSSVAPQTDFPSGFDLANDNADLLEWNGLEWVGSWSNAYITISPPSGRPGCRAIFIGSGTLWTAPGEAFAVRLSQQLVAGTSYTFSFTYVSHGWGSNGTFAPKLCSNNAPVFGTEVYIMDLPAAGYNWENHLVTFTATAAQDGHDWLFLKTDEATSSGLISAFCEGCATIVNGVTAANAFTSEVFPNPARNAINIALNTAGINKLRFEICSTSGQVLIASEEMFSTGSFSRTVDISALPEGYYFIRMLSDDKISVRPFVKSAN